MHPVIDSEQLLEDLETLAQFGVDPTGGLSRIAYNPADQDARAWVIEQMQSLGMTTKTDKAGNTIALYPGTMPDLPPIALGSHTDTVPNGGRYDGALGVLAALACVRALRENGVQLRHPVEIINFAAEEATMSSGTFGSRAMTGALNIKELEKAAWDGRPVADHLREAGLDPASFTQAQRANGAIAAYLELHIEQGGILEKEQLSIGVVEGIVGIRRYDVIFEGYANHAGTTPMAGRKDALVMAAPFISAVPDVAKAYEIVATIGTLKVYPGAPNVIPGRVNLSLEIRGLHNTVLDKAEAELAKLAKRLGGQIQHINTKEPTQSDSRLLEALITACDELQLTCKRMPSGAGHDAMCMASIAPQAMIFVPSQGGVSHSPDEYTTPEDCVNGARVLLGALLRLDEVLNTE